MAVEHQKDYLRLVTTLGVAWFAVLWRVVYVTSSDPLSQFLTGLFYGHFILTVYLFAVLYLAHRAGLIAPGAQVPNDIGFVEDYFYKTWFSALLSGVFVVIARVIFEFEDANAIASGLFAFFVISLLICRKSLARDFWNLFGIFVLMFLLCIPYALFVSFVLPDVSVVPNKTFYNVGDNATFVVTPSGFYFHTGVVNVEYDNRVIFDGKDGEYVPFVVHVNVVSNGAAGRYLIVRYKHQLYKRGMGMERMKYIFLNVVPPANS